MSDFVRHINKLCAMQEKINRYTMIQTKSIQLTKKQFFITLLSVYLKKRWWLVIWFLLLAILFYSTENRDSGKNFFTFFFFLYPILIVFRYWQFANSKDNKVFLLERNFEITENKIIGNLSDGTVSEILVEHFVKTIEFKKSYLLYLSKIQFIYIPKDSFKNANEENWFKQNIISKIK